MSAATALAAWRRWWNPPAPVWAVEAAAVVAPLAVALDVVHHWGWHRHGTVPASLTGVFGPAGRIGLPRLSELGFTVLGALVVIVAMLAAACNTRAARTGRACLAFVAAGYWWWAAETARYGTPTHARTALIVTVVALALRARPIDGTSSGWPLRVAATILSFLYLSAGWEKLRVVGSGWWTGGATEAGIVVWGPSWVRGVALDHRGAVQVAALAALVLELVAPIPLLLVNAWRRTAALIAAAFHVVVFVTMGIDFLPMAVVCVLVGLAPVTRAAAAPRGATCAQGDDDSGGLSWHVRPPHLPGHRSPSPTAVVGCSASPT